MKTYHIKDLLKKELLIVELPRKADVEIFPNSIEIYNQFTGQEETIKGSYTLLGKRDEIREEDAEKLVESGDSDPIGDRFVLGYKSYFEGYEDDIPQFTCKTATESLLSAIESKIYWVNPYKIYDLSTWHDVSKEYDATELRTFDRNRSIILVKN